MSDKRRHESYVAVHLSAPVKDAKGELVLVSITAKDAILIAAIAQDTFSMAFMAVSRRIGLLGMATVRCG